MPDVVRGDRGVQDEASGGVVRPWP
jgi:hypothetical protein